MTRRTLDGALKCALRDFLREECRAVNVSSQLQGLLFFRSDGGLQVLIFVIVVVMVKFFVHAASLVSFNMRIEKCARGEAADASMFWD